MPRLPHCAGPLALGVLAAAPTAHADTADSAVSQVTVTAAAPVSALAQAPTTRVTASAEALARTLDVVTPEDALRYLPSVLVRQRHMGDTQSPLATRTSGVGASARSLIYVDGILISALIGNNNTSASPKWGLAPPDAVERVEVLYGPFAAAFPGNSIGAVVALTTRAPTRLIASAEVQGASQSFSKYGDRATYGVARTALELGDRLGRASFRLDFNHLDSHGQPLGYATATVPPGMSAAGASATGGRPDRNRNGQPILVLGATGVEHQVEDNLSGRFTYDLTPRFVAAYTVGLFRNQDRAGVDSYLRDAIGRPLYAGAVNLDGRAYALASSLFSNGVYRLEELELAQGLSLASHTLGAFDIELVVSRFDVLKSRQRIPGGALPAAFAGGPGWVTSLDRTGWRTLDANATWRPFGMGGAHIVSFGAHEDRFRLENPRYVLSDWISGRPGATLALNRGRTATRALWMQDAWALTPELKATLGLRWERWRAYDGLNFSAAPALNAIQPRLGRDAFSPKAVLAYAPAAAWTIKASAGVAYRFPTVTELYQAVTVGSELKTPDPRLRPERAISAELSAERRWRGGAVRVSLFHERIRDALLSQTAILPTGGQASFVQNVERTHATGVELVVDQKDVLVRGLALSGWASFVDARTDRDAVLPAAVGKRLPQVPRWRGALTATYSPMARLDLSLAARYSDRAFATIDNLDVRADTYQGFGAWFVVDAHLRYQLTAHLAAGLGVQNLTNRKYFLFHPFPQRTLVGELKYVL